MAIVTTKTLGRIAAASFVVSGVVYLFMRSSRIAAAPDRLASTTPPPPPTDKSSEKSRYLVAGYDTCGYFQRTVSVLQALEKAVDHVEVEVHGGSRSQYQSWLASAAKV